MKSIPSQLAFLFLLSSVVIIESLTITSYQTSTIIVTSTLTSKVSYILCVLENFIEIYWIGRAVQEVCAKLVNVTGTCRRRRDLKFEKPEILTFDEDVEESVDAAFNNINQQQQFVPTKTLR